jgi:hypothetical protein
MIVFAIILLYLIVGVILNFKGPFIRVVKRDISILESLRQSNYDLQKENFLSKDRRILNNINNRFSTNQKIFIAKVVLRGGILLFYPLLAVINTYDRLFRFLPQYINGCGYTLNQLNGAYKMDCSNCGHKDEAVAFNEKDGLTEKSYQCVVCNRIKTFQISHDYSFELPFCECGEEYSRDTLLNCPRCKSNYKKSDFRKEEKFYDFKLTIRYMTRYFLEELKLKKPVVPKRVKILGRISGFNNLSCLDCKHEERFTGGLHLRDGYSIGYQCGNCKRLTSLFIAFGEEDKPQDLTCNCGGTLKKETELTCPACKSKNVRYGLLYIT